MPVKALIVNDQDYALQEIGDAIRGQGHVVAETAKCAWDVRDLFEAGKITPQTIDVAFIDSNLGSGMGGGLEVLRYLFIQDVVRTPVGDNPDSEPVVIDPHKIVTVGASTDVEWAVEIGSYSDYLGMPLFIDWNIRPLNLGAIISEARRLKPQA